MRIIEIGDGVESAKAAAVLLRLGAEVIKLEDPNGADSLRRQAAGSAIASLHLALDPGKRSIACDFGSADSVPLLGRLVRGAGGVIVPAGAGGELWRRLAETTDGLPPALVFDEPSRFYDAYARSAHMIGYGDAERSPLAGPPRMPSLLAGVSGVIGFYGALLAGTREAHTTALWTMAALLFRSLAAAEYAGKDVERAGSRPRSHYPSGVYRCADGYASLIPLTDEKWQRLCMLMGHPELGTDPRFLTDPDRLQHYDELNSYLFPWLKAHSRDDVTAQCQELGIPCGSAQRLDEFVLDPQPNERAFFQPAVDEQGRQYVVPGVPDAGRTPAGPARVPALGEHTAEILRELGAVQQAGERTLGHAAAPASVAPHLPLKGLVVLELTLAQAGPILGWFLGGLGATVIKIERPQLPGLPARSALDLGGTFPEGKPGERPWNREGLFNFIHANKQALTLNLESPEGRELFLALVERADVVIENFSARVMRNLGLNFPVLSIRNPRLVYASIKAHGLTGPKAGHLGFSSTIEAESGFSSILNYGLNHGDGAPQPLAFPAADLFTAVWGAACVLHAIHERRTSGRGRLLDLSMTEAIAGVLDDFLVQAQLCPSAWSHATEPDPVYTVQCAGGTWLVVSATDLERYGGLPERLAALLSNQPGDMAASLTAAAASLERGEVEAVLEQAGIRISRVVSATGLARDPAFGDWFWVEVAQAEVGVRRQPRLPLRFEPAFPLPMTGAPLFAEHTEPLLEELLGLQREEIARLRGIGAV